MTSVMSAERKTSFLDFRRREQPPNNVEEETLKVKELRRIIGPLEGSLAKFCTDECLHRYLRARNWNLKKAERMLRDTLQWRAEYNPELIQWDDIAHESETGKIYRTNFTDKQGHAILVMAPARQNTDNHDSQIKHLVYCLENAILSLKDGVEQMDWIVDLRDYSISQSPPFKTSLATLNILQNHYPERLAYAILPNAPALFETFWVMIRPFMDPKTVKKVRFTNLTSAAGKKSLEEVFSLSHLEKAYGGSSEWVYDHEEYGRQRREDDRKAAAYWGFQLRTFDEHKPAINGAGETDKET